MAVLEASRSCQKSNSSALLIITGLFLVVGLYLAVTGIVSPLAEQGVSDGRDSVVQARLGKGTEKLLEQTASHMSRLLGGQSIGGFPGFEPPDDDDRYKEKIRNRLYSAEEASHWIKEINNFLRQVVRKNPNMTLEVILQRLGRDAKEVRGFLDSIRDTLTIAESWENRGIDPSTIETLRSLMDTLGVQPW